MTWDDLREAYALGWEPINHGWTSRVTPNPPDTIINYPAPHGPSTIDYDYEIAQNTAKFQTELGATIKHFGLPAGDANYLQPAWDAGMKTVYTGQTNSGNLNDGLMNAASIINLNRLTIKRKYFADQTVLQDMKDYIDNLANQSTGAANYWGVASTHRVRTPPTENPDNGNLSFSNFKGFMDYVSGTYGANGSDSIWMASTPEVYEYLAVKQETTIGTDLVGSVLTITLDHSLVDADLRRYALSLKIDADAEIDAIDYGLGFTHYSDNKSTGLINLDWGFVSTANDITRCEELVAAAEQSRIQADVNSARTFVDVLENGSQKAAFNYRLNNIIIKTKSWKINFGNNGYTAGVWNEYGGSLTTHSPLTLKDTDGVISSATVKIQQNFSSKSSSAGQSASPADSGYFPDAYLEGMIRMYSGSTNIDPGIVRIGGLDTSKEYNVVLMGSHERTETPADKTVTVYSVNGISQELQTSLNTDNVVVYSNLSPDAGGNIDISVAKKFANWGWGVLNAIELSEASPAQPSAPTLKVTKNGADFTVNITGWSVGEKYQIWSYQRITSDIILNDLADIKASQWILAMPYASAGDGEAQPDGSVNFTISGFTSPTANYVIAVRTTDNESNFIREMRGSYTPEDVQEVVITKVLVDGAVTTGYELRESMAGAVTLIKVIGNNVANIVYTAKQVAGPTEVELSVSNTNEFLWDISALEPGMYTIELTATNGTTTATQTVSFELFSSTVSTDYGLLNEMVLTPGTGVVDITPTFENGTFSYRVREPGRTPTYRSVEYSNAGTIQHAITAPGIYHVYGYVTRAGLIGTENGGYDDGMIRTLVIPRTGGGTAAMTFTANQTLPDVAKGTSIEFTANATGLPDTVQYSFWRYDATGYVLVKDWSTSPTLSWTPARIGEYTLEARAKGAGAGSYEVSKQLLINVTAAGEEKAAVTGITINAAYLNANAQAKKPIVITANAISTNGDDLLYKFYVYDSDMRTTQLKGYTIDQNCVWTPRKAGMTYTISVLVKNQVSFGKYDAIETFEITVD